MNAFPTPGSKTISYLNNYSRQGKIKLQILATCKICHLPFFPRRSLTYTFIPEPIYSKNSNDKKHKLMFLYAVFSVFEYENEENRLYCGHSKCR